MARGTALVGQAAASSRGKTLCSPVTDRVVVPPAPRILVVDDEPVICAAIRTSLAREMPEASVTLAGTQGEAERDLRGGTYDVVVSDMKLGGGDGLAVLSLAAEKHPEAVRILITAFPGDASGLRLVNDAHVDHMVQKPFHLVDLVDLIHKSLDARRKLTDASRAAASDEQTSTDDASAA